MSELHPCLLKNVEQVIDFLSSESEIWGLETKGGGNSSETDKEKGEAEQIPHPFSEDYTVISLNPLCNPLVKLSRDFPPGNSTASLKV